MIRNGWQVLIAAVLDCEKPVIAAVNATAAGGGMHLALACDLVLAAEEAKFIAVFVRRGIAPDAGGAYLLPRLIGPQRAKELFFFGDRCRPPRRSDWGWSTGWCPATELMALAGSGRPVAKGPTKAIALAKSLANQSLETDRSTSLLGRGGRPGDDRRDRGLQGRPDCLRRARARSSRDGEPGGGCRRARPGYPPAKIQVVETRP